MVAKCFREGWLLFKGRKRGKVIVLVRGKGGTSECSFIVHKVNVKFFTNPFMVLDFLIFKVLVLF